MSVLLILTLYSIVWNILSIFKKLVDFIIFHLTCTIRFIIIMWLYDNYNHIHAYIYIHLYVCKFECIRLRSFARPHSRHNDDLEKKIVGSGWSSLEILLKWHSEGDYVLVCFIFCMHTFYWISIRWVPVSYIYTCWIGSRTVLNAGVSQSNSLSCFLKVPMPTAACIISHEISLFT